MAAKCRLFGTGMERIPNLAFRFMAGFFVFRDFIKEMTSSFSKRLAAFGIEVGHSVIDYGCGPGGYLRTVSRLVGEKGKVYALDVHPLAIKAVQKKVARHNLTNVVPVVVDGYSCSLNEQIADVIYALDMFHMVKSPNDFLKECRRLLKPDGHLIIDDGHQRRAETRRKISGSGLWRIVEESKDHLRCAPK